MDIARTIEASPIMRKRGGKINPRHPAYQRAALAMGYTGSQAYFMQQKKYVKDPVEIHNIKQRDGETIEEFMEQFKVETRRMKGAFECMRISEFMHGVNNPELIKRLNEHVPKTMEEMMITTTAFIRGEAAAAGKKKVTHRGGHRTSQSGMLQSGEAGKFKPPPPMVTPVEKRSSNEFCDFHNDKGYNTDECMQLKKQIEELGRAGKLSHLITEIKQGRYQPKVWKKEVPAKNKSIAIYMIQPCHRMTRQRVTQSFERVREITFPSLTTSSGTEGPLVIEAKIGGHTIHRMYVDGGSSTEVLYKHCFNRLRPEIKNQMVPATTSLTGFNGETIWPLGQLRLLVTIGDADHSTRAWMNFMIVRSLSLYNGIIRKPGIGEIQAVPSTAHGMLKFPVDEGIVTICSTILIPAECATVVTASRKIPKEAGVRHENFKKKRGQALERAKAIQTEVQKRVKAGIVREVYYNEWLSNPVMVKKHDGNWRMCVDFTDLNKAYPQDCYPLPEIDWKVESLCSYPFKCFLDAYKGYHQIQMADSDKEKTAFHTSQGVYCYTKMPFGVKNAGAMYQRLVDKAFYSQVGRNIEVYVDDLVIKSHTGSEMLRDIDETFRTLRKINMKLNPKKCMFRAVEGMFLGYMISPEGIKPCPDKTEAVLQLPSPRTIKEVQSLNGKLASLNRFLSKSAESLQETKAALVRATHAGSTKPKEELIVYMSATHKAISAVLMTESGQPIKQIISRPDVAGRLQKWSVMLGEYNITYRPRTSVKGQVLVDFLVENPDESPSDTSVIGVRNVHVRVDSKLVANQVLGAYVAKEENMIKYLEKVKSLVSGFANFSISQVPQSQNKKTDALSKIASTRFGHLSKQVLVEILKENSIQEKEVTTVVEEDGPTWMTPIIEYLKEGTLLDDRNKVSKLHIKARQYELLEGVLYRRSFLKPWLRCVGSLQAEYVIREIHEGSCSMHAGPRFMVAKAMQLGYYWPTKHRDARDMIRTCNDCQIHHPVPRKVNFLIVAMDCFTKWIEAEAVATITGNQVKKFMWDNIVCRFGLLGEIVLDNGKQFSDNPFKDWCKKLNITQRFTSVKHPRSNGLMERANRSLGEGIKARLGEGKKN
ncbi:reverse transcriptase domain-containing protein [Tanacetum coccineum]